MKKALFISLGLTSLFFLGCQKETSVFDTTTDKLDLSNKKSYVPGMQPGTLVGSYVRQKSSGGFVTPFAGELHFETFTYPNNKHNYVNYSPWEPSINGVSSTTANLLSFEQIGNKIILIFGSAVNGLVYKIDTSKYLEEVEKALDGERFMPQVSEFVTRTDGTSDGLVIFNGKILIDHNAPLGVSIFPIETNTYPITGLPYLVLDMLERDGVFYDVAINTYNNKVNQIKASNVSQDDPRAQKSFDITYEYINSTQIILTGILTLNNGLEYQINDILNL